MRKLWIILVVFAGAVAVFSIASTSRKPASAPMPIVSDALRQDPVTSPSIVTSPKDGKEAGFTIQVYSFREPQRAEKALANLKAAGYKAFQEVSDLGDKGLFYRVRIGGLANEAEAQTVLNDIRTNYQGGFIVKPKI
jgi:cell division septation protein DedD